MIFTTKIGAISANRRVAVFLTHPVGSQDPPLFPGLAEVSLRLSKPQVS